MRTEGLADLNITDTQWALGLVINLSSIMLLNHIKLRHQTGFSLRSLLKILYKLERKPFTKYMFTRDLWQSCFLSAISAFI